VRWSCSIRYISVVNFCHYCSLHGIMLCPLPVFVCFFVQPSTWRPYISLSQAEFKSVEKNKIIWLLTSYAKRWGYVSFTNIKVGWVNLTFDFKVHYVTRFRAVAFVYSCNEITHYYFTDASCDDAFQVGSSCYKVHKNDTVNWFTAVNRCRSYNASLAVFDDNVRQYFPTFVLSGDRPWAWIGLLKSWWTWPALSKLKHENMYCTVNLLVLVVYTSFCKSQLAKE